MAEVCPISTSRIDEKAVRMNAFLTMLFVILFIYTSHKWIIFFLVLDFLIRGFMDPKYSIMSKASKIILYSIGTRPQTVDAAPKIFAAKIGCICCLAMAVLYLLSFKLAAHIIGWLLIVFAFPEAAMGYCVGCKIYALICKL